MQLSSIKYVYVCGYEGVCVCVCGYDRSLSLLCIAPGDILRDLGFKKKNFSPCFHIKYFPSIHPYIKISPCLLSTLFSDDFYVF